MEITNVRTFNIEGAIRGMRNPLGSHNLSDSKFVNGTFQIGKSDMDLACRLIKAGKDHRKFLRQIFVSMDVYAPEYWWKQYHTYKVSTTENSSSQMHTLGKRPLVKSDFELEEDFPEFSCVLENVNRLIVQWNETKSKDIWRKLIQIMPQSFLYTKTCTLSYETLLSICTARKNHKLKEWNLFIDKVLLECPYLETFLG